MKITTTINTCSDCRHQSHSGVFTEGGAQPVCDGPNVCKIVRKFKKLGYEASYHWKHRVLPHEKIEYPKSRLFGKYKLTDKIPEWCPLKNGEQY